jgi:hypothetical protein
MQCKHQQAREKERELALCVYAALHEDAACSENHTEKENIKPALPLAFRAYGIAGQKMFVWQIRASSLSISLKMTSLDHVQGGFFGAVTA